MRRDVNDDEPVLWLHQAVIRLRCDGQFYLTNIGKNGSATLQRRLPPVLTLSVDKWHTFLHLLPAVRPTITTLCTHHLGPVVQPVPVHSA